MIGGVAGIAHGAARTTLDLDVVYRRTPENLTRIIDALSPILPYPRGAPPGLPFQWDVRTLKHGSNFTLTTTFGYVDLLGEISGNGKHGLAGAECSARERAVFSVLSYKFNGVACDPLSDLPSTQQHADPWKASRTQPRPI